GGSLARGIARRASGAPDRCSCASSLTENQYLRSRIPSSTSSSGLEVVTMMYGYGQGFTWMILMPLLWIGLVAIIIWAVVRLTVHGSSPRAETAQDILDRRFARGEIDADAYTQARAQLAGRNAEP